MPRQNFISVPVSDSVQAIFDEFVKEKDITKTAALSDMLDLYMLATDERLYLSLKKKYLNVEHLKESILTKNEDISVDCQISNTFIFMKLSNAQDKYGNIYDGIETIQTYMEDEQSRGYTWFSTESLYFGMAKKQVAFFTNLINQGQKVRILFAIGQDAGGNNDILYSAEILDISSSAIPTSSPEHNAFPDIWYDKARIWIKIKNIVEENELKADKLIVKSTGSLLKMVISNSQFHFGYVTNR